MDRIKPGFFLMLLGLCALIPRGAAAGTLLVPPQPTEEPQAERTFPESRFGQAPAKVELGVGPSYVRHAVSELDPIRDEAGEPPTRKLSRSPAGMEFTEDTTNPRAHRVATARTESRRFSSSEAPLEPGPNPIIRAGVQEVAVIASDLGFFPRTVFVVREMPVRLYVTGASKNTLCIMMDSFQVRKQVRSQKIEEITFTPNTPGKYRFYCPVNGMEGTLVVKEYSSGFAEAPAPVEPQARRPASVERETEPKRLISAVPASSN